MHQRIQRVVIVVAIAMGGIVLVGGLLIPTGWVYDTLALRIAFGPDRAKQQHLTVQSISKPSTVTFSDGQRIDVGPKPAFYSCLFRIGATIPLLLGYVLLLRRFGPKWINWRF